MNNYVAYDPYNPEYRTFETFEEAEEWLISLSSDYDNNFLDDYESGYAYIAKITHRSEIVVTDEKEDYCEKDCAYCELDGECDMEPWPYDSDWDCVGRVKLKEVKQQF